jgi:hypothetical protein
MTVIVDAAAELRRDELLSGGYQLNGLSILLAFSISC